MDQEKEVIQAVVIADNFNDNFIPFTNAYSSALLPVVNVPAVDYVLETLNRSGIEEVFLFCSLHIEKVKNHIKKRKEECCSWSIKMTVNIVSSEGCRCMGDALRDLDAKGLIRGHFILMGADTISNVLLLPILEEHKRNSKYDKGAAMTVVYKKIAPNQRTGDEVCVITDKHTNRLLYHQRLKPFHKERYFSFPLELFVENREVTIHHNLIDPQIAICGPSALPLFADNFDFLNRDDFVKGILINEEILASTIYFSELPTEEYAAKVSNWQTYQIISRDIVNRWAYPLVPDMGICLLKLNYLFWRNNIYRHTNIHLERGSILKSDIVINEDCSVSDKTIIESAIMGRKCKVGENCKISNSYIFDDCLIENGCELNHCIIGSGVKIGANSKISDGSVIGDGSMIPKNSVIAKTTIQAFSPDEYNAEGSQKLGDKAFTLPDPEEEDDVDSDEEEGPVTSNVLIKMSKLEQHYAPSHYSSSEEGDGESRSVSPIQEDSNIFFNEVLESLKRGFNEKSNPDYLILEINSSRYAYNMSLKEVNFYVVKAILSLPLLHVEGANVLTNLHTLLSHLGSVMKNYIRGEDAMHDCLQAFEEICKQYEHFRPKLPQLIHYLYDKEMITEDAILQWHDDLDEESGWMKQPLAKLIEWLNASSEESSGDDDD